MNFYNTKFHGNAIVADIANDIFDEAHARFDRIEFDPAWKNGTGYLDGATRLQLEKPVSFIDDHGRRGVIIPNSFGKGSLVVFRRYSLEPSILVFNAENNSAIRLETTGQFAEEPAYVRLLDLAVHEDDYRRRLEQLKAA